MVTHSDKNCCYLLFMREKKQVPVPKNECLQKTVRRFAQSKQICYEDIPVSLPPLQHIKHSVKLFKMSTPQSLFSLSLSFKVFLFTAQC